MAPALQLFILLSAWSLIEGNVISSTKPTPPGAFELLILHNNDMHARFEQTSQLSGVCNTEDREAGKCYGGFPRVAYVVKEAREKAKTGEGPPVLYLNAGDTYTGTAWFTIYKWKIAAECLNALNPDAVSLGNHELDEGISGLSPFIRNLTSPVVAANIILDKVPELEHEKNLHKSIILDVNGINVGIVGYLTPDTQFLADRTDVKYVEEVLSLRKEVKKLQNQGIKIIIGLGHSGYLKDIEIARDVEGLDLVIGGHSNTFLWNGTSPDAEAINGPYPTMVKQKSGRMVPVVQAYAYTKYLGRLLLTFNSKGEVINYSGTPLLLDNTIPQDPEVLKIINYYSKEMDQITEEVVGSSLVLLNGDCRLRECNVGNLITDSMVEYFVRHYRDNQRINVPIAIIQGGRIRTSITHPGSPINLTRGDWISVLPFSGNLVTLTMNGTVLLKALEHTVVSWRLIDKPGQFLQWSGMEVVYNLAKSPGSRVSKALARCSKCKDLEPVTEENEYNLMMPTFIAEGGDGFSMFDDKSLPVQKLPYAELNCVYEYLRMHSPVSPGLTGRIKLLNEDKVNNDLNSATSLQFSLVSLLILLFTVL